MERRKVVQEILDLFRDPRYLEVGVNTGETFLPLRAKEKVAVDPQFKFDFEADKSGAVYHQITSDNYFGGPGAGKTFDVIYLDGLHTFEQTLRDFCNSVSVLAQGGVVIIDDVVPNSYHASMSHHGQSRQVRASLGVRDRSWMGDVYRLVWFIDTFFQQFSFATTLEGHGQLVAWHHPRPEADIKPRLVESIARLPFEATILDASAYRRMPFSQIMEQLKAARATRA